jgi:AmmeMemoRadiSam system protein A
MKEEDKGDILLAIARESLAASLGLGQETFRNDPWLHEPAATFVTLRRLGNLRGCVGSIQPYRPLLDDVRHNTRAAAFSDTRFAPVHRDEYPELTVEVSLLSPCEPFEFDSQEDALARLRPGIDGVVFELQGRRSTFLPQVWEQLPDPREFLAHLKRKAGLPAAFWHPEVKLWRYTVMKWAESPVPAPSETGAP